MKKFYLYSLLCTVITATIALSGKETILQAQSPTLTLYPKTDTFLKKTAFLPLLNMATTIQTKTLQLIRKANYYADALQTKMYEAIEKPRIYKVGVRLINTTANMICNCAVWFAYNFYNKSDDEIQQITQQKIKNIQQNLINKEQKIISKIYKKLNITQDEQKQITLIFDSLKNYEKQLLSEPHENTRHDLDITTAPRIMSLLKTININPTSINVIAVTTPSDEDTDQKCTVADAVNIEIEGKIDLENNKIIVDKIIALPTIRLFPSFFIRSDSNYNKQVAILSHEIAHIASQHSTTSLHFIPGIIPSITDTDLKKIFNSKLYKYLRVTHEQQAEILHKNAECAAIMKYNSNRNTGYYPKTLFWRHHAQLTLIDKLHKFPEKLKKYRLLCEQAAAGHAIRQNPLTPYIHTDVYQA